MIRISPRMARRPHAVADQIMAILNDRKHAQPLEPGWHLAAGTHGRWLPGIIGGCLAGSIWLLAVGFGSEGMVAAESPSPAAAVVGSIPFTVDQALDVIMAEAVVREFLR
jgi:hypothetical protein